MEIVIYFAGLWAFFGLTFFVSNLINSYLSKKKWREKYKDIEFNYDLFNETNKKTFGK